MNATPDQAPEEASAGGRGDLESTVRGWDQSTDAALADVLQSDGIARVRAGQILDLADYLRLIPALLRMPESLDAAISVTLASLAAGVRLGSPESPAERLASRHPDLRPQIMEADALNRVAAAARAFENMTDDEDAGLPRDFGPITEQGSPRYRLLEFLGAGAFGRVYLANDLELADESSPALVALKILDSGLAPLGEDGVAEAKSARRVDHANVVRVLDRGVSTRGERYIVFEYVAGGSLADAVRSTPPPWEPAKAARLVAGVARGLQAVHSVGLLHCDLKPGNILLTPEGTPRITDFGVAIRDDQLVRARAGFSDPGVFGNLAFVSPEQFHGRAGELGPASDVYSLGGILSFLLTGELPNGSTRAEIGRSLSSPADSPPPPRFSRVTRRPDSDLEAVCTRALAFKPADRYASAGEFASDLEAWLSGHAIAWTRPSLWRSVRLAARRNPVAAWALVALIASVAGGSTFTGVLFLKHLRDHDVVHEPGGLAARLGEERAMHAMTIYFFSSTPGPRGRNPAEGTPLAPLGRMLPGDFFAAPSVRAMLEAPGGAAQAASLADRTRDQLWRVCIDRPDVEAMTPLADEWAHTLGEPGDTALLRVVAEAATLAAQPAPSRDPRTLEALLATLQQAEDNLAARDPACLLRLLVVRARSRLEPGPSAQSAGRRLEQAIASLLDEGVLPPQ